MSELLPCPFCGGKAFHVVPEFAPSTSYVRCDNCGIDMENDLGKENCVQLWNTRTSQWMPIEELTSDHGMVVSCRKDGEVGMETANYILLYPQFFKCWQPKPLPPKD